MIQSEFRFTLDTHAAASQVSLGVKKGETGRRLRIHLTEAGYPCHIPDNCYAVFAATKPDGKKIFNDCVIDDCEIIYDMTEQTVAAAGLMVCAINLYGVENDLLISASFSIIVYCPPVDQDDLESTSEYKALAALIAEAAALKEGMEEGGGPGGYYVPVVDQPTENTLQFSWMASGEGLPAVPPAVVELPGGGNDSGQNVELDTTLTQSGKAADARVVGEKMPIAAEIDDTGLASFKNTAGIVLFTLDLSGLGGDVHFGNVVISAESLRVAEGSTGTFTVCLETAPSHNQPVYLAVSDNIRLSVSPATLTFTPGNYAEPQTVTVTAIQDEDENDDCVTVTLTSRAVDARQVVVTIGDDDKRLVTDGLVLHMDYRNHVDDTADTIADHVNGVTFKNFAQFNKVDGGIYGNGTYKYLTLNTKDDAYSAFLSSMKSGNGFSVEAFGTNIPPSFYLPNYRSMLDDGSSGYSIGATETPVNVGGNPTRILNDGSTEYDGVFVPDKNMTIDGETVNLAQTKNWSKVPHYNSFVHVVHTFSSDGAMGVWVNGHKFGSDAIVENFASWDVDTMFADFSMRNAYDGSETLYTSSQRIYNRVLSEDEINTNMAVEAAKMGLSTF